MSSEDRVEFAIQISKGSRLFRVQIVPHNGEGNSIWTVDVDGENTTEIVREVGLTSVNGAFWSPDGKQIAVILVDWELNEKGEKVLGASADHHFRIEIMYADGTNRQ